MTVAQVAVLVGLLVASADLGVGALAPALGLVLLAFVSSGIRTVRGIDATTMTDDGLAWALLFGAVTYALLNGRADLLLATIGALVAAAGSLALALGLTARRRSEARAAGVRFERRLAGLLIWGVTPPMCWLAALAGALLVSRDLPNATSGIELVGWIAALWLIVPFLFVTGTRHRRDIALAAGVAAGEAVLTLLGSGPLLFAVSATITAGLAGLAFVPRNAPGPLVARSASMEYVLGQTLAVAALCTLLFLAGGLYLLFTLPPS